MQTPTTSTELHSVDSTSWHDRWEQTRDTERLGQTGRALIGVFLASIALWAGIIIGIKALIAAL